MSVAIDRSLRDRIRRRLAELDGLLANQEARAGYPVVHELNREIGDAIEEWTNLRLEELVREKEDIGSFAQTLTDIHRSISGARTIRVSADSRTITMEVQGCTGYDDCRLRTRPGRVYGCLPDMVIAAILQRALDTPIKMEMTSKAGRCIKRFSPAWMVDLLQDLNDSGAEGLVVVYKDRVLFSHFPDEAGAEALSESILLNEERQDLCTATDLSIPSHGRKVMLMKIQDVFVSICLRPGCDEVLVREKISEAIRSALEAL